MLATLGIHCLPSVDALALGVVFKDKTTKTTACPTLRSRTEPLLAPRCRFPAALPQRCRNNYAL